MGIMYFAIIIMCRYKNDEMKRSEKKIGTNLRSFAILFKGNLFKENKKISGEVNFPFMLSPALSSFRIISVIHSSSIHVALSPAVRSGGGVEWRWESSNSVGCDSVTQDRIGDHKILHCRPPWNYLMTRWLA